MGEGSGSHLLEAPLMPSSRPIGNSTRRKEGQIFTAGWFLFAFSWVLDILGEPLENQHPAQAAALFLAFGILSVAGLVLMTLAELDINAYFRRNQIRLNVVVWALLTMTLVGASTP